MRTLSMAERQPASVTMRRAAPSIETLRNAMIEVAIDNDSDRASPSTPSCIVYINVIARMTKTAGYRPSRSERKWNALV
jgi:hypothetical protein